MKKILFFEYIHHCGGAQLSTLDILSNLKCLDNEVDILDACGTVSLYSTLAQLRDIPYSTLSREVVFSRRKPSLAVAICKYFKNILGLMRYVRRHSPDILFTNSLKSLIPLIIVKAFSRVRISFFIRGINGNNPLSPFVTRLINSCVDRVFVQSSVIRRQIVEWGINPDVIFEIHNVISDELLAMGSSATLPKIDGRFRLVYVGTLLRAKGILELLQAFKEVAKKHKVELFIIGAPPNDSEKTEIGNIHSEAEHIDNVHFLGHCENVPEILLTANLFVLPSYAEGTPRSLLEAMALGVPCVATDVGGIPDIIKNGNNGFLVTPRNVQALVTSISYAIENYDKMLPIVEAALNTVRSGFSNAHQQRLLVSSFVY